MGFLGYKNWKVYEIQSENVSPSLSCMAAESLAMGLQVAVVPASQSIGVICLLVSQ